MMPAESFRTPTARNIELKQTAGSVPDGSGKRHGLRGRRASISVTGRFGFGSIPEHLSMSAPKLGRSSSGGRRRRASLMGGKEEWKSKATGLKAVVESTAADGGVKPELLAALQDANNLYNSDRFEEAFRTYSAVVMMSTAAAENNVADSKLARTSQSDSGDKSSSPAAQDSAANVEEKPPPMLQPPT